MKIHKSCNEITFVCKVSSQFRDQDADAAVGSFMQKPVRKCSAGGDGAKLLCLLSLVPLSRNSGSLKL